MTRSARTDLLSGAARWQANRRQLLSATSTFERSTAEQIWAGSIWFLLLLPALLCLVGGSWPITIAVTVTILCLAPALWARVTRRRREQAILFHTSDALESLVLLVESGLGILPAIHTVVTESYSPNPVHQLLSRVYHNCNHGVSLRQSLQQVAAESNNQLIRHTLLHLDIAGNEGGDLGAALRGLSNFAHQQWKLSVESRLKQLEHYVVFPVFVSVIGLFLLTAAVPLVPVLELRETIKQQREVEFR